jgi:hypothetical protein
VRPIRYTELLLISTFSKPSFYEGPLSEKSAAAQLMVLIAASPAGGLEWVGSLLGAVDSRVFCSGSAGDDAQPAMDKTNTDAATTARRDARVVFLFLIE